MVHNHIKKLDELTIAKIAAGEVIDRPVSIVKELVENSIDAGAKKISVHINRGGIDLIRVSDDGVGIPADQLVLALDDHATSKITSMDDLFSLRSMGFRGEALASIRHVAEINIISRYRFSEYGGQISATGEHIASVKTAAHPEGTVVEVRDLFRNIPVRQRFLKSPATELSMVSDLIQSMALQNPEIEFVLSNDGKEIINTKGVYTLDDRMILLFGKELRNKLLPVDLEISGYQVSGYISQPTQTYSNRSRQIFSVNNRWVKSPLLQKAIVQGAADSVTQGRFLAAVLNISVPVDQLDVNIHPQKLDVKFVNSGFVFDVVLKGIRQSISGITTKVISSSNNHTAAVTNSSLTASRSVDNLPAHTDVLFKAIEWGQNNGPLALPTPSGKGYQPVVHFQIFETYIVVNAGTALLLLDQHAVHERILYEKYKTLSSSNDYGQPLLAAEVFFLDSQKAARFWELSGLFTELGFKFEDFGSGQIIVREVPVSMAGPAAERLILAFIDDNPDVTAANWDRLLLEKETLQRMACRAAIKAGKKMAPEEVDAMVAELIHTPSNFTCPHGRPLYITFKKNDLERMFLRT